MAVGKVDDIVAQVIADTPLTKIAKERIRSKRRLTAGEITLLALGSPICLSLGICRSRSNIFTLYFTVVYNRFLVGIFGAFAGCSVGGVLSCIFTAGGNGASGLAMLAAGIVCAGLAIFIFYGCKGDSDTHKENGNMYQELLY